MTFARTFSLLLLVASMLLSGAARAQGIEIKGLRIGMTKEEVEQKIGSLPARDFTIAGARSKYPFAPKFYDGKLDSFSFFFESGKFEEVVSAVKEKYPDLKCDDSVVTNAMGGSFAQVRCIKADELGALYLSRFVSDIKTSSLAMLSERSKREYEQKRNERKRDL